MSIEIRIATASDASLISKIGASTFYETWRPVNTEEDMQAYLAKAFDVERIREDLANEKVNTFFAAFIEQTPVGYAKLRNDRTNDEFNGEPALELERIYVFKSHQDKYVGRALMDECLKLAREQQYKWFWLGVNIDNNKAIAFYKKYGFEIFGMKSFQLGDAVDDDYLLKLELK
jgi:ribosomal protein S18 acetylase RimI-like enzyme